MKVIYNYLLHNRLYWMKLMGIQYLHWPVNLVLCVAYITLPEMEVYTMTVSNVQTVKYINGSITPYNVD